MSKRQYFNLSVQELERIFDEKRENSDVLTSLINELSHRSVSRARKLQIRVLRALSVDNSNTGLPSQMASDQNKHLLTVEEHRRVASHLRETAGEDWTDEERKVAQDFAKHHEFLANLIEKRSKSSG